jgi:hypothetical protein
MSTNRSIQVGPLKQGDWHSPHIRLLAVRFNRADAYVPDDWR